MRKNTKIVLALILVLLCAVCSSGQRRPTPPVELKKISERLYEITGGRGANGGACIGDNAVLVIDAKMDEASVQQVFKAIEQITDKPIKYLVNTHSDGDHVSGNRYFPTSVNIIAHENCRKDFFRPSRRGGPSQWIKPELAPFVPALTFQNKMDLYLGAKIVELWYFGVGHTTGDMVVYFPEEKTAFLGDQIFLGRAQLIHSYKGGNSFEHVKTLKKMLQTLDAERFCSGHAEMTDRSGIETHIKQMKKLQQEVKAAVAGKMNLEQVKREFPADQGRLVEAIYNELKKSPR